MLFGHLLTNTAQVFADVRTYWSPEAVERVTGYTLPDMEKMVLYTYKLGAAALDGSGQQTKDGQPVIKPWWEITKMKHRSVWMQQSGVLLILDTSEVAVSHQTL